MIGALSSKTYDFRLKAFKQKIEFSIRVGNFLVKTASNKGDLKKVLELRHRVFYEEMLNKKRFLRLDVDKFDFIADHIMVIDEKNDKVVGTYRVLCSLFTDKFYSETEFDILSIKLLKGNKIELGRASISKEYRNGVVLLALWKGISNYAKIVEAKYVFGCSSLKTTNLVDIVLAYKYLQTHERKMAKPLPQYKIKNLEEYMSSLNKANIDIDSLKVFIPPLLQSYIKAGSIICGEPAYDKHFKCADFITLLSVDNLNISFGSKFNG